jgi:hypothetical protein
MSKATIPDTTIETPAAKPRKRKRVFMWFFLIVQAAFLAWLLPALFAGTGPSAAEVQHMCGNGEWSPLFTSYHDCVVHGANGLTAAGDIGKGIAVGLIISLWVAVDLILGIGRLVVVFARRGR